MPRNEVASLDELYENAKCNADAFRKYVREVGEHVGVMYSVAPLKGRERAKIKADEDYNGDAGRLVDILRGKFEVNSGQQAMTLLDKLKPRIRRVKNRCSGSLNGYRDILGACIVCEYTCGVRAKKCLPCVISCSMSS